MTTKRDFIVYNLPEDRFKICILYSDYNFITAPTSEDISEEEILELKARNDWEKELDESKMTKLK